MLKDFFKNARPATLSLRTVLAFYFVPISVVPAVFISLYAMSIFEESSEEGLFRRARAERDVVVAEFENQEKGLLAQARSHAGRPRLAEGLDKKSKALVEEVLQTFPSNFSYRVYLPDGKFFAEKHVAAVSPIPYISKNGLESVKTRGETLERFFLDEGEGFVNLTRILIKDKNRLYGVLEEERRFTNADLVDMRERRQMDLVVLRKDLTPAAASFAVQSNLLRETTKELQSRFPGLNRPIYLNVGDSRYAAFLYDVPGPKGGAKQRWGYLAFFISMTGLDATIAKLKVAILYLTGFLIFVASLLIFVFSNRLVRPIEALVLAMKRVKAGRVEQIQNIESTYEIDYLVRSFNEMARNVSAAKRALELKLEELRGANTEIKTTQGQLVQSAKMASLGQLVAGVAHELNNPIGFIYSNMHHMQDYIEKIRTLVKGYREAGGKMDAQTQQTLANLEKQLEIDFILKDMQDLTRSCLDGANRTKDIVANLRTFSRMDESTFKLADVHEGLRSTLKLLNSEIKNRITVHEEYGDIPQIECNLSQLNQVFMNLLSNAAQAIPGPGEIWIRTRLEKNRVIVEIADNGEGMSEAVAEKIFDPFFTTKKVGQGTGLGLSIAYGLIQRHQGNISVKSQVGRGTTFKIDLPLKQSHTLTA